MPLSWVKGVSRLQWKHPALKWFIHRGQGLFRNRTGRIGRGVGKGLLFNVGSCNAGYLLGTTEPEVQEVLATLLRPGMAFYDIGANVGFYSILAARLTGPTGLVISFEPLPLNFQMGLIPKSGDSKCIIG